MTCSIGFRAPSAPELTRELLARLADSAQGDEPLYADRGQPATAAPGAIPPAMQAFAQRVLQRALRDPRSVDTALGEYLSEPHRDVWFDSGPSPLAAGAGVVLDARTRMLYDRRHVFVNGQAFALGGGDARWLRQLADARALPASAWKGLGEAGRSLIGQWAAAGWLHADAGK